MILIQHLVPQIQGQVPMQNIFGAAWQAEELPALPLDLFLTNDAGQQLTIRLVAWPARRISGRDMSAPIKLYQGFSITTVPLDDTASGSCHARQHAHSG